MSSAGQPAGWTTQPAPLFYGEQEQHELAIDQVAAYSGAIDDGVVHRRVVGLYPPEWRLPLEDLPLPLDA